jgi:hypothetical protein
MPILTEVSIKSIALRLRPVLLNLIVGDLNEWDPVFSNGHGLGDGKTLVVSMKPTNGDMVNISPEDNMRMLAVVRQALLGSDVKLISIKVVKKQEKDGFFIVIGLEQI